MRLKRHTVNLNYGSLLKNLQRPESIKKLKFRSWSVDIN